LSDQNTEILDWLIFFSLRDVKGSNWNQKRVNHIYCELELNLRIKLKKAQKRPKPDVPVASDTPKQTLSMNRMVSQLAGGWSFRTLNVLLEFNRDE